MNTKPSLASASLALGTVGLLVLAVASGCGPAQGTPFEPGPDAAAPVDTDGGATPDTGADMPDGSTLDAGGCAPGTADCDGDPRNGCEAKVSSDAKNCGACKHDCTGLPHVMGATTCSAGKCVVPTASCATGFAHCSSNPDDGCEADLSKPATCGKCGTSCSGTTPVCASGTCSNGCGAGAPTLCSGSCVDTTKSATNCASCGNACPIPSHGQATCASSQCGFACNSGYHACGNACADNASPQSCGASCTPCGTPSNGYATCDGTSCGFECNAGFHKCGNVCAADTDATHCGASCTVCTVPSGAGHATCGGGSCGISCDTGNHLCNGTSCASNASTATCGTSCTPCAAPAANGHSTCDGTSCGIACDASYHQCGGSCSSNNSVQSCGASCTSCATPPNAQSTCNGTTCGFTCNAGYADCDGNAANGCEVNLTSDGNNCSTCGHSCLGGACSASACQPVVLGALAGGSYIDDVSVDSAYVFFRSNPAVYRINKSAPSIAFVWQDPNPNTLASLATDGTSLYAGTNAGALYRFAKDGSGTTLLNSLQQAQPIGPIAVGGAVVYFEDGNGGAASIRTNGSGFTWFNAGSPGQAYGIAADSSDGYFAGTYLGGSGIFAFSGSLAVQLSPQPTSIALDSSYFYWAGSEIGGKIGRMARDGSGQTTLVSLSSITSTTRVAVDSMYVYFNAGGSISRVPIAGGAPVTLATAQGNPTSIAVDSGTGGAIYWTNSAASNVMRLAK